MKSRLTSLCTTIAIVAMTGQPIVSQGPVRISPIGDSIIESFAGQASARYYLDQSLTGLGYSFDFVGHNHGVFFGPPRFPNFDQDHEAYGGASVDIILLSLPRWVQETNPDIVLMHLGTNDMLRLQSFSSTVAELEQCVDIIRAQNPFATVLISKILPLLPRDVAGLNDAIGQMCTRIDRPESRIVAVDHFSQFSIEVHLLNDGVHPNDQGERLLADVWLEALRPFLTADGQEPVAFGQSCSGREPRAPTLVPLRAQAAAPGFPFTVVAQDVPRNSLPFGIIGTGASFTSSIPLPVDLTAFGASYCTLSVAPLAIRTLSEFGGTAIWTLPIPSDPAWIGQRFYQQVGCASPSLNDLGLTLTNALQHTIVDLR